MDCAGERWMRENPSVGYAREGGLILLPAVEPSYFQGLGSHQTISGRVIRRPYDREDFDGA